MALDLESHPTLREAPGPNKASLQFGADEDNQGPSLLLIIEAIFFFGRGGIGEIE